MEKKEKKPIDPKKKKIIIIITAVLAVLLILIILRPRTKYVKYCNESKEYSEPDYSTEFEDYAEELEKKINEYKFRNSKYPTFDEIKNEVDNDYNFSCDIHEIYNDGSIYLADCTTHNNLVYTYGKKQEDVVTNDNNNTNEQKVCGGKALSDSDIQRIPIIFSDLSYEAKSVAEMSIKSCCNTFTSNFNNPNELSAFVQYEFIDILIRQENTNWETRYVTKDVLNKLGYEVFGTENLYQKFEEEYNKLVEDNPDFKYPAITEGDYVCGIPGGKGGMNCQSRMLKSSNYKVDGNTHIFKYTYDVYNGEELCSLKGNYPEKNLKPTTMNITVKFKYDEKDGYFKLVSLNNDNNK